MLHKTLQGPKGRCSHTIRRPARNQAVVVKAANTYPSFLPADKCDEIKEDVCRDMLKGMKRVAVPVSFSSKPIETAFCGPDVVMSNGVTPVTSSPNPLVLLHGFDSSCLEFRRFFAAIRGDIETYSIDLLGWGFTDNLQQDDMGGPDIGPVNKREHLYQFWKQVLGGRKMILCGASLGGAICVDFAFHYPEAVEKLVLIDAQGYIDGVGPMANAPAFLAKLGVAVLKSEPLRNMANKMAYFDKDKYATNDAMLIGRLHTHLPYWTEANVKFMQSGGYSIIDKIPKVETETLIVWGENDEILEPKYADMWKRDLRNSRLVKIPRSGHCSHLEQPQQLRQLVLDFVAPKARVEANV